MSAVGLFRDLVAAHKSGRPWGIPSICSAHPAVLRAAMVQEVAAPPGQAAAEGRPVLIESTVNQVNQFGGYTGMTPERFRDFVLVLAAETGLPEDRVLLGADHLGPYPWRNEPAGEAMEKACALAAACVRAGYRKLHLDASMPLKGDERGPGGGIPEPLVAEREAALAAAAEKAAAGSAVVESAAAGGPGPLGRAGAADAAPVYVIGTDVPPPGGAVDESGIHITRVEELEETVESCRRAFRRFGLEGAWERVVAVVVQPGVEFGDHEIYAYRREPAAELCTAARGLPGLILEGHSTDYQSRESLRELVEDGVGILKVGPALTFALREALFALEHVEVELLRARGGVGTTDKQSALREELEAEMLANPGHWRGYYQGSEGAQRLARRFSLSDRCRYYWTAPRMQAAVRRLLDNLGGSAIPLTLVSQYLPLLLPAVREGRVAAEPVALIEASVRRVLDDYAHAACGP